MWGAGALLPAALLVGALPALALGEQAADAAVQSAAGASAAGSNAHLAQQLESFVAQARHLREAGHSRKIKALARHLETKECEYQEDEKLDPEIAVGHFVHCIQRIKHMADNTLQVGKVSRELNNVYGHATRASLQTISTEVQELNALHRSIVDEHMQASDHLAAELRAIQANIGEIQETNMKHKQARYGNRPDWSEKEPVGVVGPDHQHLEMGNDDYWQAAAARTLGLDPPRHSRGGDEFGEGPHSIGGSGHGWAGGGGGGASAYPEEEEPYHHHQPNDNHHHESMGGGGEGFRTLRSGADEEEMPQGSEKEEEIEELKEELKELSEDEPTKEAEGHESTHTTEDKGPGGTESVTEKPVVPEPAPAPVAIGPSPGIDLNDVPETGGENKGPFSLLDKHGASVFIEADEADQAEEEHHHGHAHRHRHQSHHHRHARAGRSGSLMEHREHHEHRGRHHARRAP